jgi:hypothetical protein
MISDRIGTSSIFLFIPQEKMLPQTGVAPSKNTTHDGFMNCSGNGSLKK